MHYLILRPGAIGDNLLSFPVIQALRAQSNSPHVTFVGNASVLPLALDLGIAEEVSDYNSLQWSELFSSAGVRSPTLQTLLHRIDSAICWLGDPEHIIERNLRSCGIQQITIAPGRPSPDERIYIVDYLTRTLNLQEPVPPFSMRAYQSQAYKWRPYRSHPYISRPLAIHPGSGGAHKCWPIARFAALIEALWQRKTPVLLLAGPAESERLAELLSLLPPPPSSQLFSTLINAPLRTVAQQLQCCRGYIGNDSGITHLATLLAIPTVVLFGPSDPVIWHPYGDTTRILYEPVLTNLQPHTVLSTVEEFFFSAH
ncbi:MAG: glycosyltransferase family 9 protein [Ktedonobacteraceae bacterium]|nr:glycosyltransferase family 9 protein [Ktedonobacteraceae bacterium]